MEDWAEIEKSRRIKISFRIVTRFRIVYRQSYFSGDYVVKNGNKTYHFANNLYFGNNERRFYSILFQVSFKSKISVQVYMILNRHVKSSVQSGMKNGMNSIRNEL